MAKAPKNRINKKAARIRVIAGQWRSRLLTVIDAPGLRPTPDRTRETAFNWLLPNLPGARCLDLFAGTGALGLEALSRGAAHCDFVEKNPQVFKQLQQHLQDLDATQAKAHHINAHAFLAQPREPYDLIFLDPPFGSDTPLSAWCAELANHAYVNKNTRIYVEWASDVTLDLPPNWQILKHKQTLHSQYGILCIEPNKPHDT